MKNWIYGALSVSLLHGMQASAQGEFLAGTHEIDSIHFSPSIIVAGQAFTATIVGSHVAYLSDSRFAQADSYSVDLVDNVVSLDSPGINVCISPSPEVPLPLNEGPQELVFKLEGLPAGQYEFSLSHSIGFCGALTQTIEKAITIYPNEGFELTSFLESPQAGEVVSGVGLIRGWACYAEEEDKQWAEATIGNVSYQIDDGPLQALPYGSARTDTAERCPTDATDTGFGATEYWGNYSEGSHDITLFVDGVAVETRAFVVARPQQGFIKGLEADFLLLNFPEEGSEALIEWSEADQNFIITQFD